MKPQTLYKKANYALNHKNNHEEAIKLFNQLIEEHPSSEQAGYARIMIRNIELSNEDNITDTAQISDKKEISGRKYSSLIFLLVIWPLIPLLAIFINSDIGVIYLVFPSIVIGWLVVGVAASLTLVIKGIKDARGALVTNIIVVAFYAFVIFSYRGPLT